MINSILTGWVSFVEKGGCKNSEIGKLDWLVVLEDTD